MIITTLGTADGKPSLNRNVTSIAIEFNNSDFILIDCGEATLHQLMKSRLKFSNLHSIFITHLHGDHIYGLPGLLCTLDDCREKPLIIHGPRGISDFCKTFKKSIRKYDLVIKEYYNEYNEVAKIICDHFEYRIESCRVHHCGECYAYSFTKSRKKQKINIDKLNPILEEFKEDLKLVGFNPPKKAIKALQQGTKFVFKNKIGENFTIDIKDYTICEPDFKIVIALDNYRCENIFKYFKTCDTLVHESTYCIFPEMSESTIKEINTKALDNAHSTNVIASINAAYLNAKTLILTHFSNRYGFNEEGKMKEEDKIVSACRDSFSGKIEVAYDFSEFNF